VLKAAQLSDSMGRVAAAGDNAAMESFWALLQTNVLDRRRWRTRADLEYAIVAWIEHTYNGGAGRAASASSPRSSSNSHLPMSAKQHDQSQPPSTEPTADPNSACGPGCIRASTSASAPMRAKPQRARCGNDGFVRRLADGKIPPTDLTNIDNSRGEA
jgi:hypothetical protein